jgi:hypothetical protein
MNEATFLVDSSETGRVIIKSLRTGKKYYMEVIGDPHIKWGSIDPATNKLVNKKGAGKYKGSIEEEESLITEKNGFSNIHTLKPGQSPSDFIEELDKQYPTLIKG